MCSLKPLLNHGCKHPFQCCPERQPEKFCPSDPIFHCILSLEDINSSKFHGFYLLCGVCSDLENHNRFIVLSSRKQIITKYS